MERRTPTGNPSPAPTHPHRTHDTTDQWREIRLVSRPVFGKMSSFPVPPASNVELVSTMLSCTKRYVYNGFAEDMERTWHLKVRPALQKYGFCECMVHSSLKNWLRSRTHVTTVMFHNAWCFEDSAAFSYTCHNFELSECFGFEESAPFSYACHNFEVSECKEFEESALFSYTCHNCDVPERVGNSKPQ